MGRQTKAPADAPKSPPADTQPCIRCPTFEAARANGHNNDWKECQERYSTKNGDYTTSDLWWGFQDGQVPSKVKVNGQSVAKELLAAAMNVCKMPKYLEGADDSSEEVKGFVREAEEKKVKQKWSGVVITKGMLEMAAQVMQPNAKVPAKRKVPVQQAVIIKDASYQVGAGAIKPKVEIVKKTEKMAIAPGESKTSASIATPRPSSTVGSAVQAGVASGSIPAGSTSSYMTIQHSVSTTTTFSTPVAPSANEPTYIQDEPGWTTAGPQGAKQPQVPITSYSSGSGRGRGGLWISSIWARWSPTNGRHWIEWRYISNPSRTFTWIQRRIWW